MTVLYRVGSFGLLPSPSHGDSETRPESPPAISGIVPSPALPHPGECAKPGAGTAPLHRDRRSPWWWGYAVLADPDCRLMEVNGRVCAWFTTVKSARCN